ncbi:hypothetical protein BC941DRAFT_414468 [Chlamydoabsidia padenii]|nr:hypothetical protein BC941DRAFT_414468 [Chlamydoabsidia padenii]
MEISKGDPPFSLSFFLSSPLSSNNSLTLIMPNFTSNKSKPEIDSTNSSLSRSSRRTIPPLVLLSFAVIHSQVYWLYSVIYHLYSNLSERPLDLSVDDTVLNALTKRSGRTRAFSEPQQPSSSLLQQSQVVTHGPSSAKTITTKNRPRSSTIATSTVDSDGPLQRQKWIQQVNAHYIQQQQQQALSLIDHPLNAGVSPSTILDERLGRTQPPRWWQRTKRHLIRHDKQDNDHEDDEIFDKLASTLSLPEQTIMGTNRNRSIHAPRSVSPSSLHTSCDPPQQQQHHHDITTATTTFTDSQLHISDSLSDTASTTTIMEANKRLSDSFSIQVTMHQQPNHRSLARIKSLFIKSQVEPENESADDLEPKRKTILGIPSHRSTQSPPPGFKKRLFGSLPTRKHTLEK